MLSQFSVGDPAGDREPFRCCHARVNAAGYAVGFGAGENTGAGEARGNTLQPVNKTPLL